MLKQLEHYFGPHVVQGLRAAPLGDHLDSFVATLAEAGYSRTTVQIRLRLLAQLGMWLRRTQRTAADVDQSMVEAFLKAYHCRLQAKKGDRATLRDFIVHLQHQGITTVCPATRPVESPLRELVQHYESYLQNERGLTAATVERYSWFIRRFILQRFHNQPLTLSAINATDVSSFHHVKHMGGQLSDSDLSDRRALPPSPVGGPATDRSDAAARVESPGIEGGEGICGFVCSDMWKPYLSVLATEAGQALHVLDRFHITLHLNQAVDQVRRAESGRLRAASQAAAQQLKHTRWTLLRRGSRVRGRARQKLNALLASKLQTARAWELKEAFSHFWKYRSVTWAGAFLDYWTWRAMRSRLAPMKKVARMLRSHEELILNWFRAQGEISTGAVEGLNNKIRVVTKRSYGFRTYKAMEIALYHTLGRLPEPESAHRFC